MSDNRKTGSHMHQFRLCAVSRGIDDRVDPDFPFLKVWLKRNISKGTL